MSARTPGASRSASRGRGTALRCPSAIRWPQPLAHSMAPSPLRRAYKEIRISDEDGRVESLKDRFAPDRHN